MEQKIRTVFVDENRVILRVREGFAFFPMDADYEIDGQIYAPDRQRIVLGHETVQMIYVSPSQVA